MSGILNMRAGRAWLVTQWQLISKAHAGYGECLNFSMAMASSAFAQGNVFVSPPFYIARFPSHFI
jgi:hypothetical protein